MVPFGHPPASWCLGFVKKKKSSGQTFFLPYNLVTFKQAVHPWSHCRVTYMKSPRNLWPKTNSPRVVGRLGHQSLSSVNQSELIHYNPCALWVKLPREGVLLLWEKYTALCTSVSIAYLEHVSKMRSHTNLHCPMSATQCNTFLWHTVNRQQVIFGEVGVMFGTRALCGHLGIWAVSSIQQYSVLSSIPKCFYSKVIVPLEILFTC